jgi:AraC family transcriptional activator of pobA
MVKMGKIATYNISRLRKIFELTGDKKDFLFIGQDQYTPSTEVPFRTDTYAITFLKKGELRLTTGLSQEVITGPCLLTIGPSIIRSIERVEADPLVDLLLFKESFFLEDHTNVFSLMKYSFFEDAGSHVLPLSDKAEEKFTTLFRLLQATLESGHVHENIILRNYIHIILCEIDASAGKVHGARTARTPPLLAHFKTLLSQEVLRQRSVRFYAAQLHVTPKYLSELVKEQTGRTAGEWIDQTVILEAKVLLQQKELSISQVADSLSFSDQSAFGKFFKVNTGLSPLHYRNSLDG